MNNAESVGKFQPRVAATLGSRYAQEILRNSEGVATALRAANRDATLSGLRKEIMLTTVTQGFKANTSTPRGLPAWGPRPGLELANAFSVIKAGEFS